MRFNLSYLHLNNDALIFFVGLVLLLSSCENNATNKKDFSDYDVGMFINGIEFHMHPLSLFSAPRWCGFKAESFFNSSSFIIIGQHRDIGSNKSVDTFFMRMVMLIDSTRYDPTIKYFFSNTACLEDDLYNAYEEKEHVVDPILIGYMRDQNNIEYTIKEGWLLLGENQCIYSSPVYGGYYYDFLYCFHCAKFDFIAESSSGETLIVTNGYCKYREY